MADRDLNLRLRITGDGKQLQVEFRKANGEVVKFSDNLEGGAKRGTRALRDTERQTRRLSDSTRILVARLAGVAAGYISVRGASRLLSTITQNTIRQTAAYSQLQAAIESTGGAAGRTIEQLTAQSAALQRLTRFSNEEVEEMQAVLLTFTQVREEVFDKGLNAVLDIATRMKTDLQSAALQVGKALNDPIRGLDGLSRAGIQFNEAQKETIRLMVESGDVAGAQNKILEELQTQFGGAARAARNDFGGALAGLQNDWQDLLKFRGELPELTRQLEAISERLRDPQLAASIEQGIVAALGLIPPTISAAVTAVETITPLLAGMVRHGDKVADVARLIAVVVGVRLVQSLGAAAAAKVLNIALAAQLARGWTAASVAGTALATASRAAAAGMTLMGGPVGVVIAGLTALALLYRHHQAELRAMAADSEEAADALRRLQEIAADGWQPERISEVRAHIKTLQLEIQKTEEQLLALQRRRASGARFEQTGRLRDPTTEEEQLAAAAEARLQRLNELIRLAEHEAGIAVHQDIADGLNLMSQAGDIAVDVLERLGLAQRNAAGGFGEMAAASKEITDPLERQVDALRERLIVLRDGDMELLNHRERIALAAAAEQDAKDATNANTEAVRQYFAELRSLTAQIEAERIAEEGRTKAKQAAAKAEQALRQQAQGLVSALQQLRAQYDPLAAEQARLNELLAQARQGGEGWQQVLREIGLTAADQAELLELLERALADVANEGVKKLEDALEEMRRAADPKYANLQDLNKELETLQQIFDAGLIDDGEFERLLDFLRNGRTEAAGLLDNITLVASTLQGIGNQMGNSFKRGSKEAQLLQAAMIALNAVLGISAILTQGQGEPYSAWGRMLAMASLVASLGVQISGMSGGGFGGAAERRQESQGTGSVLGDLEAKSESISRATETTANAVTELVGINRGMLRALLSLQAGIESAIVLIARGEGLTAGLPGAPAVDRSFAGLIGATTPGVLSGPLTQAVDIGGFLDKVLFGGAIANFIGGKIFGIKSKVTDEGISILSGTIAELIEGTLIGVFQDVKTKGAFGLINKSKSFTGELDPAVATQFGLIVESLVDTVREAAIALGILPADIQQRLDTFVVQAQKISLKDLSAEEQRAELEAVFGKLFDDLSAHVVPFIDQFQQLGEGIGEALVRVATGVQVTQEAVRRLGFALDEADPERLAQFSERLIGLVGDLDSYISGVTGFFSAFAPDDVKLSVFEDELTRALDEVVLALPRTADEFWALMQSLDATTEAGAEQIATLIRLTGTADAYYKMLDRVGDEQDRAAARLAEIMRSIEQQLADLTLDPLVNESRRLRAAQEARIDTMVAEGAAEHQLERAQLLHTIQMERMAARLRASALDLYALLTGAGAQDTGFGPPAVNDPSFTHPIEEASNRIRDAIIRGLEGVEDWLIRSQLTDPSLTSPQRFQALQDRFHELLAAAHGDDPEAAAEALRELPGIADQLMHLAPQMYGSATPEFQDFMQRLREQMAGALDIDVPDAVDSGPPTYGQIGAIGEAVGQIVTTVAETLGLTGQLLETIGEIARLEERSPFEIAKELNIPLAQLIADIVDLKEPTTETVHRLAGIADTLGTHLPELITELGLKFGDLMDAESLMFEARQEIVSGMPEGIRDQLQEHLDAIADATTETDAREALDSLIDAVNELDPAFKNALAPYFEEVTGVDPTLGVLEQMRDFDRRVATAAEAAADLLARIRQNLEAANTADNVPGFQHGGIASGLIRTGEAGPELVVDNPATQFFQRHGLLGAIPPSMNDTRIVERLDRLIETEERAAHQAAIQRQRLADQQIVVVDRLSISLVESARASRSDRAVAA